MVRHFLLPCRHRTKTRNLGRIARLSTIAALLALLVGCGGDSGSSNNSEASGSGSLVDGSTGNGNGLAPPGALPDIDATVQDIWLLQSLDVVRADGTSADALAQLLDDVATVDATAQPVVGNITYTPIPQLDPRILSVSGQTRAHIHTTAGILSDGVLSSILVIATPDISAGGLVGIDDTVYLNLGSAAALGGLGDPVVASYYFATSTGAATEDAMSVGMDLWIQRLQGGTSQIAALSGTTDVPALQEGVIGTLQAEISDARGAGGGGAGLPAKSRPLIDGIGGGAAECRSPGIGCVDDLLDSIAEGFENSLDNLFGPDPGNANFPPPPNDPPPPPPDPCRTGNCGTGGLDPHVRTFDSFSYSPQAVGEFTAVMHEGGSLGGGAELQWRFQPRGSSTQVSVITAVAFSNGTDRVMVEPGEPWRVQVNGNVVTLSDNDAVDLDSGVLQLQRGTLQIDHAGWLYTFSRRGQGSTAFINVVVSAPDDSLNVVGMLGNLNGNRIDDLRTRDGSVTLPTSAPLEDLYGVFVDSWRLVDGTSLFDYEAGESTATFTDLAFPDLSTEQMATGMDVFDPLEGLDTQRAETLCRLAGIDAQPFFKLCVLDVTVTGDISFLAAHRWLFGVAADESVNRFDASIDGRELQWWQVFSGSQITDTGSVAGNDSVTTTLGFDTDDNVIVHVLDTVSGKTLWSQTGLVRGCSALPMSGGFVAALFDADTAMAAGAEMDATALALMNARDGSIIDLWQPADRIQSCSAPLAETNDGAIVIGRRNQVVAVDVVGPDAQSAQLQLRWQHVLQDEPLGAEFSRSAYDDVLVLGDSVYTVADERDADRNLVTTVYEINLMSGTATARVPLEVTGVSWMAVAGNDAIAVRGRSTDGEGNNSVQLLRNAGRADMPVSSAWTRAFTGEQADGLTGVLSQPGLGEDSFGAWSSTDAVGAVVADIDLDTGLANWTSETSSFDNNGIVAGLTSGGYVVSPFGGFWLEAFDADGQPAWSIPETPRGLDFPTAIEPIGLDSLIVSSRSVGPPDDERRWAVVSVGTRR